MAPTYAPPQHQVNRNLIQNVVATINEIFPALLGLQNVACRPELPKYFGVICPRQSELPRFRGWG